MAIFSLLPNEIVCEILQAVLAEDVENFAQVSDSRLGSIGSLLKEVLISPCISMYILRTFPPYFASQSEC